ncbi:NADAR family protein [soil metagenome]
MLTREALVERIDRGESIDLLFFWGHTPKSETIDASCLSQWFPAAFVVDGVRYATAEHFMMAEKARTFGDDVALDRVLAAKTPAEAKAVGRSVRDYDDAVWEKARGLAVVRGNVAKFGENAALGAFLANTGDRVLVEASPSDTVWGIGLAASHADARSPAKWRGRNLLGFALMAARETLAAR